MKMTVTVYEMLPLGFRQHMMNQLTQRLMINGCCCYHDVVSFDPVLLLLPPIIVIGGMKQ